MLKGKELFLLIFTGNKNEKKKGREEKEKFSWLQNWKKKSLREKNNLYILG